MWPFSSFRRVNKSIHFGNELDRLLRGIPQLNREERRHVRALFQKYRSGGITRSEIERAVRQLKSDTSDGIDSHEANAIRKKLLNYLDGK